MAEPLPLIERMMEILEANLQAGLSGVHVERNRDIEIDIYPSVILMDGGHEVDTENHGIDDIFSEFHVELYVNRNAVENLGTTLIKLYGDVTKIILADREIGGLALHVEELRRDTPEVVRREGQAGTNSTTVDYEIHYHRRPGDPFTLGP